MNGVNTNYSIVTQMQHAEDIRRAAEFRTIRDARLRTGAQGIVHRIFSRIHAGDERASEMACEQTPQTIV